MVYNPYQRCLLCKYEWKSRVSNPKTCPRCKSRKIEICKERNGELVIEKAMNIVRYGYSFMMDEFQAYHDKMQDKDEYIKEIKDMTVAMQEEIQMSVNNDFLGEDKI